jgi:hypothetical protein
VKTLALLVPAISFLPMAKGRKVEFCITDFANIISAIMFKKAKLLLSLRKWKYASNTLVENAAGPSGSKCFKNACIYLYFGILTMELQEEKNWETFPGTKTLFTF